MPVRSSRSVIVKPVPKKEVIRALQDWTSDLMGSCTEVRRVGYFGSYARGDYTPRSDLDLLVLVSNGSDPEHVRDRLDTSDLPVPCELFVIREKRFRNEDEDSNPFLEEVRRTLSWVEIRTDSVC